MANYIVCPDGMIQTGLSREEVMRRLGEDASAVIPVNSFGVLLDDILEKRLTKPQEIENAIASLGKPLYRYYSVFIARAARHIPAAQLRDALEKFFPNAPIAQRDSYTVLFISCDDDENGLLPFFDSEGLNALLAENEAFAAISTMTCTRDDFTAMYGLTERTLRLGERLHTGRSRLFLFEDYADYIVIDICAHGFASKHRTSNLIPLTHPTVAFLFAYDIRNNDNLTEVLYHYCRNNCNIAKTSASAYMHRNTIAAKLAKLRSLVTLDLSDSSLQQRIIFSYQVLHYMEHYLDAHVSNYYNIQP